MITFCGIISIFRATSFRKLNFQHIFIRAAENFVKSKLKVSFFHAILDHFQKILKLNFSHYPNKQSKSSQKLPFRRLFSAFRLFSVFRLFFLYLFGDRLFSVFPLLSGLHSDLSDFKPSLNPQSLGYAEFCPENPHIHSGRCLFLSDVQLVRPNAKYNPFYMNIS